LALQCAYIESQPLTHISFYAQDQIVSRSCVKYAGRHQTRLEIRKKEAAKKAILEEGSNMGPQIDGQKGPNRKVKWHSG